MFAVGHPSLPPRPRTPHDLAVQVERPAEQHVRRLDPPFEDELTDLGTRADQAVHGDGGTTCRRTARSPSASRRVSTVPARPLPYVKSWPITTSATPVATTMSTKRIGSVAAKAASKRCSIRSVIAARRDQLALARLLADQRRSVLRSKQARGMRLERERARRSLRIAPHRGEKRLVAEMDAVEVADGDGPALQRPDRSGEAVVDAHRRA